MKDLKEIIKQTPVVLNIWGSTDQVFESFDGYSPSDKVAREKVNILFASYGDENYSGSAFVLFEKDGQLFEVNGGHCSCYGLEGQWEPEKVVLAELENRLTKGSFGTDTYSGNPFAEELKTFLGI